tara:strand:+ start:224 stop:598 length:375 start_codon:yes stop_codon:yes gene_type:complete
MKLELKHLAPYLPYSLKYLYNYEILELDGLDVNGDAFNCDMGETPFENIKPILRPLSFFKGNIIREIRIELDLTHNQTMEFLGFIDGEIQLQNISYGLFLSMCKNHIDFNNLIPAGLAIDINTL